MGSAESLAGGGNWGDRPTRKPNGLTWFFNLWRPKMQSCSMTANDVHAIRQKLQLILAVADGQNALIVERNVKEIDQLLPRPFGFYKTVRQ